MPPDYQAEPSLLGIAGFMMYLSTVAVPLTMVAVTGCGLRGDCAAPILPFMCLAVSHWIIQGLIMSRSVELARSLLVPFGVVPFLVVLFMPHTVGVAAAFQPIVGGYLLVFGVGLCLYLYISQDVQAYAEYQRQRRKGEW